MESKKNFIIHSIYYIFIAFFFYLFFNYIFGLIFPLIIGLMIATIVAKFPKINYFSKKFTSIFYVTTIYVIFIFFILLFSFIISKNISLIFPNIKEWSITLIEDNSILFYDILQYILKGFGSLFNFLSKSMLSFIRNIFQSIPTTFLNFLLMIISSYYFSINYQATRKLIFKYIPYRQTIIIIKNTILEILFCLFKIYTTTISINFIILLIGLSFLKIPFSFSLSIMIAIIDIFPILGIGLIFIPWCIYEFIIGHTIRGFTLLLIYILCLLVKSIIEPKIIAKNIGISLLESILCMLLGAKLFGIFGILFAPSILMISKSLKMKF